MLILGSNNNHTQHIKPHLAAFFISIKYACLPKIDMNIPIHLVYSLDKNLIITALNSTSLMRKNLLFLQIFFFIFVAFATSKLYAQPFTPVAINGFNQDVVAESGTSSLTTTTVSMDGFTVSNKVMYTSTFRTLNGFGGGGIPDNGVITDASGSYQMADYTGNNALLIQRNQSGDINITTPAQYSRIRILCLSTEGTSLVNATLQFSDGSSTSALTNYSLGDWFNNTTNLVLSGFGRCTRATPATGADAYPNNPRMYYIDIPLTCADRQKNLSGIHLDNVTTAGTNAPYPNAIFFAVSAVSYSQSVTETNLTNATCTAGGSVTLDITGSGSPYNVTWNTTPAQSGLTASNLAPGPYTATITDANGCVSTHDVTIGLDNNLTLTTNSSSTICYGASLNVNTTSNATTYSWLPTNGVSDPTAANPVLSPTTTTTYTVTGTLGSCPAATASFTVTVNPEITLNIPTDVEICAGASYTSNISTNATSYQWLETVGVSDPTALNPVFTPTSSTAYHLTVTSNGCSISGTLSIAVSSNVQVDAGQNVTITAGQSVQLQATGTQGTYLWTPATGLSATNILNPVASPNETTTYTLTITTQLGCTGSDDVKVEVVPECANPMNAITPNGDGINDKWLVSYGNCQLVAKVSVFNRYGHKVYESENYQNDWQGTYKGKPLPDATYYYVIEFKLNNGRTITKHGDLTILR